MNRILVYFVSAAALLPALSFAQAETGGRECSANHYSGDGLVSYAEAREQRLAAASLDSINPGQNGSIRVHGWNQNDVLVKACVQTAASSDAEARSLASQISLTQGPGKIEPSGPEKSDRLHWDLSYEVWLPNSSNLDLGAHDGSISVEAVRGQIRFHTTNGSVHLTDVGGDVDGSTTNGSLSVDLTGKSWNGSGLRAATTNGSVRLNLPDNFSANIEASTVNGKLRTDFPATVSGEIGKSMSFQLGSGGPTIQTTTVNGGVHIARRTI